MERKANLILYFTVVLAIIFFGSYAYVKKHPPSKILALDLPFDLAKIETKQTHPQFPVQTCDEGIPDFLQDKLDLGTSEKKEADLTVPKLEKKKDKPKSDKENKSTKKSDKQTKAPIAPEWRLIYFEGGMTIDEMTLRMMKNMLTRMLENCSVEEKEKWLLIDHIGPRSLRVTFFADNPQVEYKVTFEAHYGRENRTPRNSPAFTPIRKLEIWSTKSLGILEKEQLSKIAMQVVLARPKCFNAPQLPRSSEQGVAQ